MRQARYVVLGGRTPDADGGIIEREQISDVPAAPGTAPPTWGGETQPSNFETEVEPEPVQLEDEP